MSHEPFLYWNSRSTGSIECFENQDKSIPMDLAGISAIVLIAKKRINDLDSEAVFSLTLGSGLTLDPLPIPKNKILYVIPALSTLGLTRSKTTTLWLELIKDYNDSVLRQSIEQFTLPVKPSVKEDTP